MNGNRKSRTKDSLSRRLDRLVGLARAALFWEQFWRAVMPPLLVAGLFLALSFAGLWLDVGRLWRMIGVGLFGVGFLVALLPLFRLARPSRQAALQRIDRDSGLPHRPASSLEDSLANAGDDPATQALWRLHRERLARHAEALRAALPSPRMVEFDRYALRAAVLVAVIASAFVAGPEKYARVLSAFDWRGGLGQEGGYRVDAWIDPPPYTGKPPVLLKLAADGIRGDHPEQVTVPTGSKVIVRSSGGGLDLQTGGGLTDEAKAPAKPGSKTPIKTGATDTETGAPAQPAATATPAPAGQPPLDKHEHHFILRGDGRLAIRHSGLLLGLFDLAVIPDKPPRIELTDAPRANLRGSLTLSYKIEDDYGVVAAVADFTDPKLDGRHGPIRSLVPPPRIALVLPSGPGGLGETEMTTDLSDHPWAGARVKMVLTATDEAGNDGKSVPIEITLPEKHFEKPLARALAEQRRDLVFFPDEKDKVETALEALMIAPDLFGTSTAVYLGLDVAIHMLLDAKSDADILATADFLWNMALQIENGDLSQAERDLRAAEQELRQALQRNASDAEIRRLTEKLREAMNKYLNQLAAQQQRQQNAQDQADTGQSNAKSISRKDLQAMLDRMQEMARAGDRAAAQKMLEQLQNTLDNLETAQRRQGDPTRREMNRALNQLDQMMRDQQDLRDKTHRQAQQQAEQGEGQQGAQDQMGQQGQGQNEQGQDEQGQNEQEAQGQQGMGGQNDAEALRQQQQALRNRLEELQKRLRQTGHGQQGLDDAQRAMKQAEQGLAQGGQQGNEAAVGAQGRALESLRRGAEQLAQQMQGEGQGEGQGDQGSPQAEEEGGTDPLGRPMGGNSAFNPNSRYDPMGLPAAQRAQRVLEELRRRLSDPSRAREEMDYLERLLHGY